MTDSQIKSKLYQGTDFEVDVVFDGYKFQQRMLTQTIIT